MYKPGEKVFMLASWKRQEDLLRSVIYIYINFFSVWPWVPLSKAGSVQPGSWITELRTRGRKGEGGTWNMWLSHLKRNFDSLPHTYNVSALHRSAIMAFYGQVNMRCKVQAVIPLLHEADGRRDTADLWHLLCSQVPEPRLDMGMVRGNNSEGERTNPQGKPLHHWSCWSSIPFAEQCQHRGTHRKTGLHLVLLLAAATELGSETREVSCTKVVCAEQLPLENLIFPLNQNAIQFDILININSIYGIQKQDSAFKAHTASGDAAYGKIK